MTPAGREVYSRLLDAPLRATGAGVSSMALVIPAGIDWSTAVDVTALVDGAHTARECASRTDRGVSLRGLQRLSREGHCRDASADEGPSYRIQD